MVFLVHRPDFYDKEDRPGEADIIMAKHRNGPTDTFHLAFLGATSKFKTCRRITTTRGCNDGIAEYNSSGTGGREDSPPLARLRHPADRQGRA